MNAFPALAGIGRRLPPWIAPVASIAVVLLVHWETFASLLSIWISDTTFGHCFAIPPISAWLLWRRRDQLSAVAPQTSWVGATVLAALNALWAVSELTGVSVTQHFAVVAMVPAALWTIMGTAWVRRAAFPLAFLVFAVPFGDALVPMLRTVTADATVVLLRLTGVPVIQDGLYFSIPSGNFEVIKACSGIRYLIATVALATLFAHFTYRSWRRILIFMSLALVVPIIGNSLRAYLIVMIAHLSKMKYAVGIDHFIYGWLMFALMIALLFWIGGRFREIDRPIEGVSLAANAGDRSTDRELPWSALLVAAIVVTIGSVSPIYIRALAGRNINEYSDGASFANDGVAAGLPTARSPWSGPSAIDRVGVAITGESMLAEHRWIGAYRLADDKITVQVFFYLRPSAQKARLTRLVEELYTPAGVAMPVKVWTNPAAPSTHAMLTWQMQSASVNALHFGWYLNPSGVLTSATGAKLSQAWSWLRLCPSPEAFVLISFPAADGDYERAERSAASFMERHSMLLDSSVIKILRASAGCAP